LDAVLLNTLAEAFAISERVPAALVADEALQVERKGLGLLAAFCAGETEVLCIETDGRLSPQAPRPTALMPGAFNPVHEGHWELAAVAARLLGVPVAFELSVYNVDKPPLAVEEVRRRMGQFTWRAPLWLTRAPTFAEKARLFPGAVFVVGADTAARIVQPRFYGDSAEAMGQALAGLRRQGCRFLVAGRADELGRFMGLEELG